MELTWWQELLIDMSICIPTCCCFCLLVDYLRDKRSARRKQASFKAIVEQMDKLHTDLQSRGELQGDNEFVKNLP